MAAKTVTKVTYVDNETVIGASNLNAMQDAINDHASLIDGLDTNKVSKVAGKGLSTNDFTNDAQSKLSNLPARTDLDTTLESKVDKRTSGTEVYMHNATTQGGAVLTETPTAGAVPLYGTGGVLKAAPPVADNDVVRKAEVDEVVNELSDSATGLGSKAPAIVNTVSGAIASFPDGADSMPVKELVVNVEPAQDLHGYDNPWPGGAGKNILQMIAPSNGRGISFSLNDDGSLHVSGTATADATFYINGSTYASNTTSEIPAGTYTVFCQTFMTGGNENTRVTFNGKKEDGTNPSSSTLLARADGTRNTLTFTTAEPFKAALYLVIASGEVCNFDIKIQLEAGSSATAYAPYSNICPISGWTGANVEQRGKNLLTWPTSASSTSNGITFTYNADGSVTMNGTASANAFSQNLIRYRLKPGKYIKTPIEPHVYTFAQYVNNEASWVIFPGGNGSSNVFTVTEETAKYDVRFRIAVDAETTLNNYTFYPYCYVDGETDLTWEPYTGSQISVTFPIEAGTVYGGTLTINPDRTGQLVVDRKLVDVANTNWTYNASFGGFNVLYANFSDMVFGVDQVVAICSKYKTVGRQLADKLCLVNSSYISSSTPTIGIIDTTYASKTEFVAGIADVQIVYELATPTTYQLTESEISGILTTLYGTNNIWADCGDTSVTYAADTKLYIEHLTQPTEDDMTANVNIAANKFFMLGNTLYFSTAAIAQGETIVPGTNCNLVSLADALNQLNT